nr:MAG TPA: hypothetical protein [Caudoviricetes sp.]
MCAIFVIKTSLKVYFFIFNFVCIDVLNIFAHIQQYK